METLWYDKKESEIMKVKLAIDVEREDRKAIAKVLGLDHELAQPYEVEKFVQRCFQIELSACKAYQR